MQNKIMVSMLMGTLALITMALPASAKEQSVTSKSGVITITLPSEQWLEGASDNRCAVFSNGTDYIAFNHYKVGEDQPEIIQPKGEAYESYQTITIQNGYYLEVAGYCDDKNDFDDLKKAVNSAIFNMDRMHADTHKMVVESMSVEDTDMILYCNADQLNIRPDGSGDGNPVGMLHEGDEVHVTGIVKNNGVATGWVRIDFNGTIGYVSDAFLSSEKQTQQKQADSTQPGKTGNKKEVYFIDSSSVTIYEYSDGKWRADDGIEYWTTVEHQWASSNGATLYDYISTTPNGGLETGNTRTIYWGIGTEVDIKEFSDGNWYDSDGKLYWYIGDGQWNTNQGETLYDDPDWVINHRQDNSIPDQHESDIVYEPDPNDTMVTNDLGAVLYIHDGGDGYYYSDMGHQLWCNEAGVYIDTSDNSQWY